MGIPVNQHYSWADRDFYVGRLLDSKVDKLYIVDAFNAKVIATIIL